MGSRFENLKVWQLSHEFVLSVYKVTNAFPLNERFRLTDQLCRSAASVAANIVEGNSRKHNKEFLQFVNTSYASLEETKYHLLLSKDLGYLNESNYEKLIEKAEVISKMLNALRRYLKGNSQSKV